MKWVLRTLSILALHSAMFLCGACMHEITLLVQQLQFSFRVPWGLHLPLLSSAPPTDSPQLHCGYHVPSPNQTLCMHMGQWRTTGAWELSKERSNEPCNITHAQFPNSCECCWNVCDCNTINSLRFTHNVEVLSSSSKLDKNTSLLVFQ